MFHPRLHNINYLHVIKSCLTKIKSSQVVFSIRFFMGCLTLLKRKQLFAAKLTYFITPVSLQQRSTRETSLKQTRKKTLNSKSEH